MCQDAGVEPDMAWLEGDDLPPLVCRLQIFYNQIHIV